jgi:hypothetical protein
MKIIFILCILRLYASLLFILYINLRENRCFYEFNGVCGISSTSYQLHPMDGFQNVIPVAVHTKREFCRRTASILLNSNMLYLCKTVLYTTSIVNRLSTKSRCCLHGRLIQFCRFTQFGKN